MGKRNKNDELRRLKNQLEASEIRNLRSNFGLAMRLAQSTSLLGEWQALFHFEKSLLDVTPEDIRRVVRLYFTPANRTVATLVSLPPDEGEDGRGFAKHRASMGVLHALRQLAEPRLV